MAERRPRRRAEEVTRAIHAAVVAELRVNGYWGVTFEKVAKRARTGKAVLYKRYDSRVAMVFDALVEEGRRAQFVAGSLNLHDDLIVWLSGAHWRLADLGPDIYRGLVGESSDHELESLEQLSVGEVEVLDAQVLNPARRRGELGPDPIEPYILEVPIRLSRENLIFSGGSRDTLVRIVEKVAIPLFREQSGWVPQG